MKVLVSRNAFSYDFGGAERLAVHLAEELENNGIQALVLSRHERVLAYAAERKIAHKKAWWWSRQNWGGARVAGFPFYCVWQSLLFGWYICMVIRYRPDVVHLISKDDFIAGTFAARLFGKSVVWTDAADLKHIFLNHRIWYKNPVGKLVYLASRFANIITLVSESERQLVSESVGHPLPKKFIVMHVAGRDEKISPVGRSDADKHVVIFCATSRLVEAKGISELIAAFQKISKQTDAYRLWLTSSGPDEARFKKEAGTNRFVTFFGHVENPLRYVAESDVFVHPTHHEGFSLSLTEAAMLGKPLIATDVGGNPELVNPGNGILVPVRDPTSLAAAMKELGANKTLRSRLGAQAREDYVTKFDFATIVRSKLIPAYERITS